jgi:uncharacterized protein YbaR (Trm112 family)
MGQISKDLLEILACPKCKAPVVESGDAIRCTNKNCGLVYPIRNGIPVMLIEEAATSAQPAEHK